MTLISLAPASACSFLITVFFLLVLILLFFPLPSFLASVHTIGTFSVEAWRIGLATSGTSCEMTSAITVGRRRFLTKCAGVLYENMNRTVQGDILASDEASRFR